MSADGEWTGPRRPGMVALAIFAAAALLLCYPMLSGQFIGGPESDQYNAGFAFRHFAAQYWREHHAIPLWNPYIFGGMPFIGGMHGDIFYPTAWLRWILPTGTAMNLGFGLHIVLAGVGMYALLRGFRTTWAAAVLGGLAYEFTGMVASLVSPGHDGKLFVSALAPLLFLALLRGVRDRRPEAFGAAALLIGLCLHGHPQMSYYLLVASAIWAAYLLWFDTGAPRGSDRTRAIVLGVAAVGAGMALYAVQAMPFAAYIPYSPRADGVGWEYATSFALPPSELFSTFYPEVNGVLDRYTGGNGLKHHTEHLGALVILLAVLGLGGRERRRERIALGIIAGLFLLVAFGGHTPFYRLWYEVLPKMKQVRAAGMAFYLTALPLAVFAGFGAERLLKGQVAARKILFGAGIFAVIGLLGAGGGMEAVARAAAHPQLVDQVAANDPDIRAGGLRLLIVAILGGAVLYGVAAGKLRGAMAAGALSLAVYADLWSVERRFFFFHGTADQLFAGDAVVSVMQQAPLPYRVWDPRGAAGGLGVYPGSWLMGAGVPQLFGYHGNELRGFDELFGGKNIWDGQANIALLELYAVRFAVLRDSVRLPGFHRVSGPTATTPGVPALLYEADTTPPYARLMAGAVKVPAAQVVEVAQNPGFPLLEVAVYPDTSPVSPTELSKVPDPPNARATVASWEPGRMRITIEGRDERPLYLVVAENWYKDWRATVDGRATPLLRAQNALLSVTVPPGAREVAFEIAAPEYIRGRAISLGALVLCLGWMVVPRLKRRGSADG